MVDEEAGGVDAVMRIAAKMGTAVGDHAFPTGGGKTLGDD